MKKTVDTGSMSFQEALEHTLTDKPNGVITVGVIRGGGTSWAVYGEGAKQLPDVEHTYEIAGEIKHAELVVISQSGHEIFDDHPEIVFPAIRNFVAKYDV